MRRIYACVMVLGIAGILGFGVMRGLAQTEGPALKPDQLKPVNYTAGPNSFAPAEASGTAPRSIPKSAAPLPDLVIPPAPDALPIPILTKPEAIPVLVPPSDPTPKRAAISEKPAMPVLPFPEVPMPPLVLEPDPIPVKKPVVPVQAPKREPLAIPVVEPRKDPTPVKPELPSAIDEPLFVDPVKPAAPMVASANRLQPSVSIETIAPETMPFGQPIAYEIVVKNNGPQPVSHVRVDEELGAGTKFIGAEPAGEINGDKVLWMLGTLNAGEEKRIKVTVKPGNEGDLNTKPRISYSAATAMSIRITRPLLIVTVQTPEAVQVGDEVPVQINVTNKGSGEAEKIVLKAILTEGLKHPGGRDIEAAFRKLAPGESQNVTLRIQAANPGAQSCTLHATADGAAPASVQAKFDIRQPKLNLAVTGPVKCVVRAEPVFKLEVTNPGTSATEPVQIAAAFPEGLDFLTASDGGAFDANTRTVSWNLGSAPSGSKRHLTVKTKSSIAGNLAVRVVAQAGPKLNARAEAIIQAEGVPALMFEVVDLEDPIEVGKETTYEIRVANTGTTHCTNVKVTAAMSEGLVPGQVTSSVPHKIVGQTLVFEPVAKLAVKADLIIRVKAKGTIPGDQRFKVQLSCDQMKQPVVKEESTSFFQQ